MNRSITRLAAVALGGLAVVTVCAALVIAALAGRGLVPAGAGWVVPLVAGGSVGLLSWFLLTDNSPEDKSDAELTSVTCTSCGTQVREDWRLCPYCGGTNESALPNEDVERVSAQVGG